MSRVRCEVLIFVWFHVRVFPCWNVGSSNRDTYMTLVRADTWVSHLLAFNTPNFSRFGMVAVITKRNPTAV